MFSFFLSWLALPPLTFSYFSIILLLSLCARWVFSAFRAFVVRPPLFLRGLGLDTLHTSYLGIFLRLLIQNILLFLLLFLNLLPLPLLRLLDFLNYILPLFQLLQLLLLLNFPILGFLDPLLDSSFDILRLSFFLLQLSILLCVNYCNCFSALTS